MSALLEETGRLAVAFIAARKARMAARRARTAAAIAFYDEFGGDAAHSDESDHPKSYTPEFVAATEAYHAAYTAALNVEKSCRQRLYRAAAKADAAIAAATGAK